MPKRARLFIGLTIGVGSGFLAPCFGRSGDFADLTVYTICFALALLSSSLKVRLPGISGTISTNFLFILMAIAVFSLSETILLASVACLVQCLWKARRRPKVVQVLFNVSVLAISSGVAYRLSHLLAGSQSGNLPALLVTATFFYFIANTFLVSGVLSMVENRPLMGIWHRCHLWTFPCYLAEAILAGLVVASSRSVGWPIALLMLPIICLVHLFYRMCVEHIATTSPSPGMS